MLKRARIRRRREARDSALHRYLAGCSMTEVIAREAVLGEEFSVAEIAAALQVPAGTVKTRLMNARRKLREALEGGKSDDGA